MQPISQSVGGKNKRRKQKRRKLRPLTAATSPNEQVNVKQAEKRRSHSDDSSEEKVVKKKKNKPGPPVSAPAKKGAKSIRQQKREKYAARVQEAEYAAKDAVKKQCTQYLSQWKHNKDSWKFMKAKQVWLYKNKFNSKLVPDQVWPIFLEYFASAQGNIKNMLMEDSKKVIEKMDMILEKEQEPTSSTGDEQEKSAPVDKPDDLSYSRARDIIQHLDE